MPASNAFQTIRQSYLLLLLMYGTVAMWVWIGVFVSSERFEYASHFLIFSVGFLGTATICLYAIPLFRFLLHVGIAGDRRPAAYVLLVSVIALATAHIWIIGEIPLWSALATRTVDEAALVRQNITLQSSGLTAYITTFIIHSVSVVIAIYFLGKGNKSAFWLTTIIATLYGTILLQKSYPLLITVPLAAYCFFSRRFALMAILLGLGAVSVLGSFFATNPRLVPPSIAQIARGATEHRKPIASLPQAALSGAAAEPPKASEPGVPALTASRTASITVTYLFSRVVLHPGYVASKWFESFPERYPYAMGCGYRFLTPLIGCAFQNTPRMLHADFYPRQAAQGLRGSFNAAHFAEEYANFGKYGLLLSGALAASVLLVSALFTGRSGLAILFALNMAPIASLSSVALHTTLLSLGWGLTMLLALIFFPATNQNGR